MQEQSVNERKEKQISINPSKEALNQQPSELPEQILISKLSNFLQLQQPKEFK